MSASTSPGALFKLDVPYLEKNQSLPVFFLAVWVLYLIFSPFYVFPKGTPQPADFLLALGIFAALATEYNNIQIRIRPVYLIGGLFVALAAVINLTNYVFYPHVRLLLTPLYYSYNFAIFLFVTWLFGRAPETMIRYTIYALLASVFIQLGVTAFFDFGYRGARATAGFENPNQLAYWALLTATMVVFARRLEKHLKPIDYIILGIATFLQALALSKAGIIAFTVFLFLLLISPCVTKVAKFFGFMGLVFFLIFLSFQPESLVFVYKNLDALQNVFERIEGIGTEADDSPEVRGYYRLAEFPFYTLVGAGEGSFKRFDPSGRELHSGIATIIFSYGIFGATLFFAFLGMILNKQPWYYILLFSPIILFGLPHQNFRFSHFWVLLGINYGLFLIMRRRERERQRQKHE